MYHSASCVAVCGCSCSVHILVRMQAAAQAGDTRLPGLDEVVSLHFVALVQREGRLLELDGRKPFPIDHGSSSADTVLQVPEAHMDFTCQCMTCSQLQSLVDCRCC